METAVQRKIINTSVRKKKRGIAFKMLALMIAFIAIIFTAIFVSFNILIEEYVKRETNQQIENALSAITNVDFRLQVTESIGRGFFGRSITTYMISKEEMQQLLADPRYRDQLYDQLYKIVMNKLRMSTFNTEVNTVLYNNIEYTRLYPDESYNLFQNLNEIDDLLNNISLNSMTIPNNPYRTSTSHGNYYLTLVDLEDLFGLSDLSMAFYINTAKYDTFVQNINFTLLFILVVATVFSIIYVAFISRNISKPVQDLCNFADEIGRGNFKQTEYNFHDREFIDLNNRMNETARKLEKNDEDQKTFFQNVSHELKTPLMSIKGYAEGIKYGVFSSTPQQEEASDIIISETDRLNNLVSDLLYISKLDSFKKIENKRIVNLNELVNECAEKVRGLLINSHKKINIIASEESVYIECDESSLIRAILNVIANCVQYANSDVDVSIYTDYTETNNNIVLSVKDDGNGIDENDLPNIFKRFYKGKSGKHGIGLAITKAIVEQHDGEIYAKNNDTGAEFIFKFKRIA